MNDSLRTLYRTADADEDFARNLAGLLAASAPSEAEIVALARDHGVVLSEADVATLLRPAPANGEAIVESELEVVSGGRVIHCSAGARFLFD